MTGIRLIAASNATAVRESGGRTALLVTSEQDSSSIRREFCNRAPPDPECYQENALLWRLFGDGVHDFGCLEYAGLEGAWNAPDLRGTP